MAERLTEQELQKLRAAQTRSINEWAAQTNRTDQPVAHEVAAMPAPAEPPAEPEPQGGALSLGADMPTPRESDPLDAMASPTPEAAPGDQLDSMTDTLAQTTTTAPPSLRDRARQAYAASKPRVAQASQTAQRLAQQAYAQRGPVSAKVSTLAQQLSALTNKKPPAPARRAPRKRPPKLNAGPGSANKVVVRQRRR